LIGVAVAALEAEPGLSASAEDPPPTATRPAPPVMPAIANALRKRAGTRSHRIFMRNLLIPGQQTARASTAWAGSD
jgi:hypothetical protein